MQNNKIAQSNLIVATLCLFSISLLYSSSQAESGHCNQKFVTKITQTNKKCDSKLNNKNTKKLQNRYIEPRTGVEIIWVTEANMFPRKWTSSPINLRAKNLSKSEIKRHLNLIEKALAKYPTNLIKKHLTKIYLVGGLTVFEHEIAGTYYKKNIYLNNQGIANGYTNKELEGTFHHELSSLILKAHASQKFYQRWQKLNPQGFQYQGSSIAAIKASKNNETNTDQINDLSLKRGFVNLYAQSNLENDFNEIAERLFITGNNLSELGSKYSNFNKKIDMFIELYQSVDPMFNREYFETIAHKK